MKTKTVAILILLSGLFGGIVATVARPRPQEKPDELSESQALAMMRMVNTLQVVAHEEDQRHQYASLDVLVYRRHQNHELWLPNLHLTDSSTGTLKNYTVSVVVSADGQHYVAEMIGSGCALALFSNESAVIYTANALGCKRENLQAKPGWATNLALAQNLRGEAPPVPRAAALPPRQPEAEPQASRSSRRYQRSRRVRSGRAIHSGRSSALCRRRTEPKRRHILQAGLLGRTKRDG